MGPAGAVRRCGGEAVTQDCEPQGGVKGVKPVALASTLGRSLAGLLSAPALAAGSSETELVFPFGFYSLRCRGYIMERAKARRVRGLLGVFPILLLAALAFGAIIAGGQVALLVAAGLVLIYVLAVVAAFRRAKREPTPETARSILHRRFEIVGRWGLRVLILLSLLLCLGSAPAAALPHHWASRISGAVPTLFFAYGAWYFLMGLKFIGSAKHESGGAATGYKPDTHD